MKQIVINNIAHGHKIAHASGCFFNEALDQVVSLVTPEGKLLGGNIYTGYTGASIHIHTAGFEENWASRAFLWIAFDYPFNQLGVNKVFGQVPETNQRALEIDRKLGFKVVARIEDVFPDEACLVLALAREDCRWLKYKPSSLNIATENNHGGKGKSTATARLF